MKIKVTVDSTNDLSKELMEKYDITAIPLSVYLNDKQYKDMVDIFPQMIHDAVDNGAPLPKTSAVNVDDYRAVFEEILKEYDAIVHINLSSEMSSTHQNARIAAEGLNVYPVDSRNLSTGSGLLALRAREMAREGMDAPAIAEAIAALTDKVDASFLVHRLDYLHKGGRCSAVAALGANILKLRPCIEVHDGKMGVAKKYRGAYIKCLEQYVRERLTARDDIDTRRIFITHSPIDHAIVEDLRGVIEECMHFDEILDTDASCTVSSHCGENCLGILYFHK